MTKEEAIEFFSNDRYATKLTGIEILEVGENYAKCGLKLEKERHFGAHGQVMGGTMFTLADFAFAVATNNPEKFTMTASSNMSFYSQPKDDQMFGECTCVRAGRRACFFEVTVTDGLGNLLAKASFTGITVTA